MTTTKIATPFFIVLLFTLVWSDSRSQTVFTSTGSGNWTSSFASTGTGNPVSYVIRSQDSITVNASGTASIDSLKVYGVLSFNNGMKVDMDSNGIVMVLSGGNVIGGSPGSAFRFQGGTSTPGIFNVSGSSFTVNGAMAFHPLSSLPVSWLQIDATIQNGKMNVSWSTAAESNNSHFVVEIAHSSSSFERVYTAMSKAVHGNSVNRLDYKAEIELPFYLTDKKMIRVRIKQVDFDGSTDHSEEILVHRTDKINFQIQNTGSGIQVSSDEEPFTLKLYSLTGALLTSTNTPTGSTYLSVDRPGTYVLAITSGNHTITTRKIYISE